MHKPPPAPPPLFGNLHKKAVFIYLFTKTLDFGINMSYTFTMTYSYTPYQ